MIDRSTFPDAGAGALLTRVVRPPSVRVFGQKDRQAADCACRPGARGDALRLLAEAENEVANWRVSLRPDQPFAPPPPTRREHLRSLGHSLETDDEIERACRRYGCPSVFLTPAPTGFGWEDRWDNFARTPGQGVSTCSRASIWVTQDQRLGRPARSSSRGSGGLQTLLPHLGSELHDDLTVSLLQARLIELNLPIGVEIGTRD